MTVFRFFKIFNLHPCICLDLSHGLAWFWKKISYSRGTNKDQAFKLFASIWLLKEIIIYFCFTCKADHQNTWRFKPFFLANGVDILLLPSLFVSLSNYLFLCLSTNLVCPPSNEPLAPFWWNVTSKISLKPQLAYSNYHWSVNVWSDLSFCLQDEKIDRFLALCRMAQEQKLPARKSESQFEAELKTALAQLMGARGESLVQFLSLILDKLILLMVRPPTISGHTGTLSLVWFLFCFHTKL